MSRNWPDSRIFRAVIRAIGKSAAQACPALGAGLEHSLLGLERCLAIDPSTSVPRLNRV